MNFVYAQANARRRERCGREGRTGIRPKSRAPPRDGGSARGHATSRSVALGTVLFPVRGLFGRVSLRGARPRLAHLPPGARRPLPIGIRPQANPAFARPVRRTAGCRVEGSVCSKDSLDCCWSVALGRCGVAGDRQIWALKVGGRTGRMAIGVALDTDEVCGAVVPSARSPLGRPAGAGV